MTELFKDRYKIGLFLASLFFLGIAWSIYTLYSLPHNLMLIEGYQRVLSTTYLTLGATFLAGAITIWYALKYKTEVIVFRDKEAIHDDTGEKEATDSSLTTISLDTVRVNIENAKTKEDILQSGLTAVCKQLEAGQGIIYMVTEHDGKRKIELHNGYALTIGESTVISFEFGEGLIGQSAADAKTLYIDDIPEGYIKIISGLGSASPRYMIIVPMKKNENVIGIMEIVSFTTITEDQRKFIEESAQLIANSIRN
jgi:putative methionine-R-sulfoxide reductase with GAF domain